MSIATSLAGLSKFVNKGANSNASEEFTEELNNTAEAGSEGVAGTYAGGSESPEHNTSSEEINNTAGVRENNNVGDNNEGGESSVDLDLGTDEGAETETEIEVKAEDKVKAESSKERVLQLPQEEDEGLGTATEISLGTSQVPSAVFLNGISSRALSSTPSAELGLFHKSTNNYFGDGSTVYNVPLDPEVSPLSDVYRRDSKGDLATVLAAVSDRIGERVVPSAFTKVPTNSDMTKYYTFKYQGETYFAPTDFESVVEEYKQKVLTSLKEETVCLITVAERKEIEGRQTLGMYLGPKEVTRLSSLFANHNPKIIDRGLDSSAPLTLVIGDYSV
jgi:hypothetical protein